MAQLAIKGHKKRGNEVIALLEMLGGENTYSYTGDSIILYYHIDDDGDIECYRGYEIPSPCIYFTIQKFLEKFPYKVGDIVKVCGDNLGAIISMRWEIDHVVYRVKLNKNGYETSKTTENLQPYKEETETIIEEAKCVIFPKGKNTWEGFVPPCKFKDGDVFRIKSGTYYLCIRNLFDEFGNIIFHKDDTYYSSEDGYLIPSNSNVPYKVEYCADEYFRTHETNTLEKLITNKFDINTLVPFESKVLVRDTNKEKWKSNFWGFYDSDVYAINYPYECCGASFAQCIPYEGNEHLLGTTNDCSEFYKNWEE